MHHDPLPLLKGTHIEPDDGERRFKMGREQDFAAQIAKQARISALEKLIDGYQRQLRIPEGTATETIDKQLQAARKEMAKLTGS